MVEWIKVVFIDSWALITYQPFPFVVVAVICFLWGKHHSRERIEVLQQRLEARNEDLQTRDGELKRSNETLSAFMKLSSPMSHAAHNLREQMNFLAAKLLDYSYFFPPVGHSIGQQDLEDRQRYYDENIRPELEYLLLKFREHAAKSLAEDLRVLCEYRNFQTYIKIMHEVPTFRERHGVSEMAQGLALLALRVQPVEIPVT
jgi:hypothetical protein